MKLLFKLIFLTIALSSFSLWAEAGKIIKWVDKNGVTHYGDKSPLPSNVKKSSILNNQGITVQRIEQKNTTDEQDQAIADKARYDNALLASYNSIEEIDIARNRNTRIDELALSALQQKHKSLNAELDRNNNIVLERTKKNRPAPTDTVNAVKQNKADIKKTEQQITEKKQAIEKINQRYENDKARYAELQSKKDN